MIVMSSGPWCHWMSWIYYKTISTTYQWRILNTSSHALLSASGASVKRRGGLCLLSVSIFVDFASSGADLTAAAAAVSTSFSVSQNTSPHHSSLAYLTPDWLIQKLSCVSSKLVFVSGATHISVLTDWLQKPNTLHKFIDTFILPDNIQWLYIKKFI